MSAEREMPRYRCHKEVWALEIAQVSEEEPGGVRLIFKDAGYAPIEFSLLDPILSRYFPVDGDFYVVYDDGYKSFSPRKAFIEGYTPLGQSFAEIKQGIKG